MNADKLSKHYDKLTAWERLPLIIAALARDDEAEHLRLMQSAPRHTYKLPLYHGLGEGLEQLTMLHHIKLLDLSVVYWQMAALLSEESFWDEGEASKPENDLYPLMRMLCFRLVVLMDAWKLFSADMRVDPTVLRRDLPGYTTMVKMEQTARAIAFTTAEADAYLREFTARTVRRDTVQPQRLTTAEKTAADMRAFVEEQFQHWL